MPNDRDISVPARVYELIQLARSNGVTLRYSDAMAVVQAALAIRGKGYKRIDVEGLSMLEHPLRLTARTLFRVAGLIKGTDFGDQLREFDRLDAGDGRLRQSWTRAQGRHGPWQPPRPRGVFTQAEWRRQAST